MTTKAYKGYLIKIHPFNGDVFIEKDGHLIGRPNSEQEARQAIDELTQ